jgi:hypothetical protein
MVCDMVIVKCDAFPKCKENILRKDFYDHTAMCGEVKVSCQKGICGEYIRRKKLEADHDCIEYLK